MLIFLQMFANDYVAFEEIYPITLILFSEIYQSENYTGQQRK